MGTWGIALSSNDTYADIYGAFYKLFNEMVPRDEIVAHLEKQFNRVLLDSDESNDFVFAITKALWETGDVPKKYMAALGEIVSERKEVERWLRLGGTTSESERRHLNVVKLQLQISSENQKPRKPRKTKLVDAPFEKGDCIAFRDRDGFYTCAVVLSHEKQTEFGLNLLLVIDYFSPECPTQECFEDGYCLMMDRFKEVYEPWTQYCYAKFFKRLEAECTKVTTVKINIDHSKKPAAHSYGLWSAIPEMVKAVRDRQGAAKRVKARRFYRRSILGW